MFSLIIYLIRFNTNKKRHFLNNEGRKEFQIRKKAKIYSIRGLGKISVKVAAQAFETGDFLNIFLRFLGF